VDWLVQGSKQDETGDVFLAPQMTNDGATLFLSYIDGVASVPIGGGAVKRLTTGWILAPKVWVESADDLLVVVRAHVARVPKAGTSTDLPEIARLTYGTTDGEVYADYDPGSKTIFGVEEDKSGVDPVVTFFRYDVASGATTDLAQVTAKEAGPLVLAGEQIVSTLRDSKEERAPSVAHRVPIAGGDPIPLEYGPAPSYSLRVVGEVHQGDVFWFGRPPRTDPSDLSDLDAFVYRAPPVKNSQLKEVLRVKDGEVLGTGLSGFRAEAAGGYVLGVLNDVYFLPDGATSPTRVFCGGDTWQARGITAAGNNAYVAITGGGGDDRVGIARLALR
jgi:hypothetical protein